MQGQKILQGAAQLLPVIDAAAQHQLTVQLNAARRKLGKILQHLTAALIGQHPHPQLRVGGVDRYKNGADVHLNDAVDLML